MKINILLKSTRGEFEATGIYDDGKVIVCKGSRINRVTSEKIGGSKTVKAIRDNNNIVDINGVLLLDCSFSSPSTAANFVTGRSANGYVAWRVDEKNSLGRFLGRERKGTKTSY